MPVMEHHLDSSISSSGSISILHSGGYTTTTIRGQSRSIFLQKRKIVSDALSKKCHIKIIPFYLIKMNLIFDRAFSIGSDSVLSIAKVNIWYGSGDKTQ